MLTIRRMEELLWQLVLGPCGVAFPQLLELHTINLEVTESSMPDVFALGVCVHGPATHVLRSLLQPHRNELRVPDDTVADGHATLPLHAIHTNVLAHGSDYNTDSTGFDDRSTVFWVAQAHRTESRAAILLHVLIRQMRDHGRKEDAKCGAVANHALAIIVASQRLENEAGLRRHLLVSAMLLKRLHDQIQSTFLHNFFTIHVLDRQPAERRAGRCHG
mmetsp:Transcript_20269/g.47380  ORF Transcript_20269/g.47380 Transcript_20269/m.47380 type:complete len:218 (+) Transcript_20269:278-931(+)